MEIRTWQYLYFTLQGTDVSKTEDDYAVDAAKKAQSLATPVSVDSLQESKLILLMPVDELFAFPLV